MSIERTAMARSSFSMRQVIIILGIIAIYILLVSLPTPEGLTLNGQKSIALMLAAVLAWVFEVLPLGISAILMTVLQMVLGTAPLPKAMQNFATPTLFFLVAMFCVSIAFQNSGLSQRIVLWATMRSKGSPSRLLFIFMMTCALLSTILADVPVTAMMFPVALVLLQKNGCLPGKSSFGKAVMLGVPIAALIGGAGTPSGSGMNILTMTLLESTTKVHLSFLQWSTIGIPMVLLITPVAWWAVTRVFKPEISTLAGMDTIREEFTALGGLKEGEKKFLLLLLLNLLLWATDSVHHIPLPVISVIGAALFFLPGIGLMEWSRDASRIGWDIVLLVGAANSLGMAIWDQGAATWIARVCLGGLTGLPVAVLIAVISTFTVLIHLIIPVNPAIVSVLLPSVVALANSAGINPAMLAIPLGFSVSAAMLLPLDAVPMVTFPAGYYKMSDMLKPGWIISIAWVIIMTLCMFIIARPLGLL